MVVLLATSVHLVIVLQLVLADFASLDLQWLSYLRPVQQLLIILIISWIIISLPVAVALSLVLLALKRLLGSRMADQFIIARIADVIVIVLCLLADQASFAQDSVFQHSDFGMILLVGSLMMLLIIIWIHLLVL